MKKLNAMVNIYWDVQKTRVASENRIRSLGELEEGDISDVAGTLQQTEALLAKDIRKSVRQHPFYPYWLKHVKGIAEVLSAQLICLIRGQVHTPECQEKRDKYFSKRKKGEGKRAKRFECDCPIQEIERFRTVSALWAYAGLHTVDGKAPRRKKGETSSWNHKLRMLMYNVSASFVRCTTGPYRKWYDEFKAKEQKKHPDLRKMHIEMRVRRRVSKLFLAHVFNKWYEMKGLEAPEPYAFGMLGHSGYIPPPD